MVAMSFRCLPVKESGKLIIRFENSVGNRRVVLDTGTYVNALGQSFTITNFKYYISNITLTGITEGGLNLKYADPHSYLITQDDSASWSITLEDMPEGSYQYMTFIVGVDSIHNCSGAQSGALDPINGMFWTWNTGYIFFKLEGKSPSSNSPGHIFEYHIGGYKAPTNFLRTIMFGFRDQGPMKVNHGKVTTLYMKTDVAKLLNDHHTINFAKLSSVTDFHNADTVVDNYDHLFSVIRVSNEW